MNIKSLEIENILSIGSAKVDFAESGLVLVEGWNHDLERSNGAGKTAIFNALSFALFDKLPRKITASEITRRGAKSAFVKATVDIGGVLWVVTRRRPKGAIFEKDGIIIDITQEEWEKTIKLSYSQFLVSIYCAQRSESRFIFLNDSDKKNFLLQLLDLNEFQSLKQYSDELAKNLTDEISKIDIELASAKSKIDAHQESVVDEQTIQQELSSYRQDIVMFTDKIKELQQVAKPDISNYLTLENQIFDKEKEISVARSTRSIFMSQYNKLMTSLSSFESSPVCKECGSSLDLSRAKALYDADQNLIKTQMSNLKKDIDIQDKILYKENDIKNLKNKIFIKKNKELESYNIAQNSINEYRTSLLKREIYVNNVTLKLVKNSELLSKISELSEDIAKLSHNKAAKSQNFEFYKTLSNVYSSTGAQAYILDSVIDSFNEIIDTYIGMVWPSASYSLNSYRENAKGDVTAKFSESLVIDGSEVSIGSLSGGELRAFSLCIDFTVIDILQRNFGIRINPIILDEPFEGLDSVGKEIVIGLLEKLSLDRQILVVDHGSEAKSAFTKTIFVEKRNGISSIRQDL